MEENNVNVGGMEVNYMARNNGKLITQSEIFELLIKKSKSGNEYKKYVEITSMLVLGYYRRLGNIGAALKAVYEVVNESKDINELITHYNALKEEEKANADSSTESARAKIANMLLNDYKRRFGEGKKEAYNVLVLQS
ncbi:MAG: hypothetical protein ACP5HW_03685, partial [Candidatus Micrarchaeia archaeon]